MAGIWIFSENRDLTLELLTAGRELAAKLGVRVAAFAVDAELANDFIRHGADEVFLMPPLAEDQPWEAYVPTLADAAGRGDPDVILIGATPRGKEIAARLAVKLDTGLCSCCTSLGIDNDQGPLCMERMIYGGAAIQSLKCFSRPQMATIPPRTFEKSALQKVDRPGTLKELKVAPKSAVKVVGRSPKRSESVDLADAKTIVCVGRGIEKPEDIALAKELADALGGEIGCSRPIAEELNWLPEERYLGISGKKVKPNLYVGVGVSGQIQHVTGIRDSKIILAINRDENAPIFEAADFGIVGDLYQVVPMLTSELRKARQG